MFSKLMKQVTVVAFASLIIIGGGKTVSAGTIPASIQRKYRKLVAPNVRSSLNIRAKASTSSAKVGTFKNGDIGTVISRGKTWTKIRSGSVKGYVASRYVLYGTDIYSYASSHGFPKKATVNTGSLRVRKKANRKSQTISSVSKGAKYRIYKQTPKWVKVKVNGKTGYLFKQYVTIGYYYTKATPVESASQTTTSTSTSDSSTSGSASQIVSYALQFVGNPYVYGGNSLTEGTDCSGFINLVFAHFGYSVPRTSKDLSACGTQVDMSSLQKGDLLFYKDSSGNVNHVTMYIGDDQVVHASNSAPYPAGGIKISNIGYRVAYKAMRVIS